MDNQQTGQQGEELAAAYLTRLGYDILARNWRQARGELDIIAAKQGVTYFVEVKTGFGSHYSAPADKVNRRKRGYIARTAQAWFAQQGQETLSALLVAEVDLAAGTVTLIEDMLL